MELTTIDEAPAAPTYRLRARQIAALAVIAVWVDGSTGALNE